MPVTKVLEFCNIKFGKIKVCKCNDLLYVSVNDLERAFGKPMVKIIKSKLKSFKISICLKGEQEKCYIPVDKLRHFLVVDPPVFPNQVEFVEWLDKFVLPQASKTEVSYNEQMVWMENMIRNFEARMNERIYATLLGFFKSPKDVEIPPSLSLNELDSDRMADAFINVETERVVKALEELCHEVTQNLTNVAPVKENLKMCNCNNNGKNTEFMRPNYYFDLETLRQKFNARTGARFAQGDFSSWLVGLGLIYPRNRDMWKYDKFTTVSDEWITDNYNGNSHSLKYSLLLLDALEKMYWRAGEISKLVNYGYTVKDNVW